MAHTVMTRSGNGARVMEDTLAASKVLKLLILFRFSFMKLEGFLLTFYVLRVLFVLFWFFWFFLFF